MKVPRAAATTVQTMSRATAAVMAALLLAAPSPKLTILSALLRQEQDGSAWCWVWFRARPPRVKFWAYWFSGRWPMADVVAEGGV
eukprot:6349956-Prymnesium_polylepis.1